MPRSPNARLPFGSAKPRVPNLLMRVWDAPTRLFHWLITLLVIFSYVSIKQDWVQLHFLSGYTILTLLLFRIAWGFVGSQTARFSQFMRSPIEGLRHLAHFPRREPDTEIGHNAAGGWMVLILLAALAAQVGTGLFSNDDFNEGPSPTWSLKPPASSSAACMAPCSGSCLASSRSTWWSSSCMPSSNATTSSAPWSPAASASPPP